MSQHFRAKCIPRRPLRLFQTRRSLHYPPNGFIQVQRVKFRRPWFRRTLWTAAACGMGAYVWAQVVLSPLSKIDIDDPEEEIKGEKRVKRMKRAENSSEPVEEDEEDDESLFIPLSLPLLREGQRYTDEDPEWQTFLKYSKDEKSLSYLKEQLAYDIAKALSSDLNITALVGTPKTVSSSLRHEFPARAPPKYVRHGLDLSEDYTGLVIKALDVEDGDRIWNLLEPYRAISTFLLTTHIYLLMKRSRLQNRLNQSRYVYPSQNEQSVNATVPTLTTPFLPGVPGSVGKLPELDSRAAETKSDNVKRSPFQPLIIKDESTKGGLDKANTFTLDIIIAAKIFLFLLEQRRTRYLTPPPGVFIIEGMVTVTGTEGQCHVYTKALFDPKKRHFNTFVHVRSVLSFLNKPSTKQ